MARQLTPEEAALVQPPPRIEYDWDLWFDGNTWELVRGVDFHTTPRNFQTAAFVAASRREYKHLKTWRVPTKVYLRCLDNVPFDQW